MSMLDASDRHTASTESLADILRKCQLHYCVLHGWSPSVTSPKSDLDIAIASDDLEKMEETLRHSHKIQIVQLFQHEASCYYFVLAIRDEKSVKLVSLDVAVDYRRDGLVLLTERDLLRCRRQVDGVWVAGAAPEFEYLLVKKIMKGAMPQHQKTRIHALCGALGQEARIITRGMLGERWGNRVVDWAARQDWAVFEKHLPILKRVLCWRVVGREPLTPVRYWLAEFRRRWGRWRHPTGLWIAVLGPDGAGKSTLISRLAENLSGAFRRTDVFHLRPNLVRRPAPHVVVTDPHGKKPYSFWLSVLKLFYYGLTYTLGYALVIRSRLARSALVLFDRYYHDVLVDPRRYRYGGPVKLVSLVQRFIPMPDLLLILDVPVDALRKRKQEVSAVELSRQRDSYRRLARNLRGAVLLDGSLSPDEVASNATRVALAHLQRRYGERRRASIASGTGMWRSKSPQASDTTN